MKTKYWIALLAVLLAVCLGLSLLVMGGEEASRAQITSGGKLVRIAEDRAIALSDLAEELKTQNLPIFLVGDGAKLCYNAFIIILVVVL